MQAETRIQDDPGLASRYLAGQLSGSELQAYEQHLLDNPDAVAELEATARMKVGLANLRETGQLEKLLRAPSRSTLAAGVRARRFRGTGSDCRRALARRRRPRDATLVATASELIDPSGRPLAPGSSYALLRTRSSAYDAVIELPPSRVRSNSACAPKCQHRSMALPVADPTRWVRRAERQRQRAEGGSRRLRAALRRFLPARSRVRTCSSSHRRRTALPHPPVPFASR